MKKRYEVDGSNSMNCEKGREGGDISILGTMQIVKRKEALNLVFLIITLIAATPHIRTLS